MTSDKIQAQQTNSEIPGLLTRRGQQSAVTFDKETLYKEMLKSARLKIKLLTKENCRLKAQLSTALSSNRSNKLSTHNELFSVISHDLRSPLSSILNLTKMVVNNPDEFSREDMINNFNNFEASFDRMYRLVENILHWSSLQLSKYEFKREINLLSQVVEETLAITSQRASEKEIQIISKVNETDYFCADYNMVGIVLRNLIYNAIKFSQHDGEIEISAKIESDKLFVYVRDDGIGIAKSNQAKIFSPDIHFSTSGTQGESGTGIGLKLCKNILKNSGGTIACQSAEGQGSCFYFSLPTDFD